MSPPSARQFQPGRARATRIVGIGASAGGLEALEQFLAHVPPASGLAYVVVQHLDPVHKAMLAGILQRATPMPVREASASMLVSADTVYVIPPNSELTVAEGALQLAEPAEPRGLRLPVDVLFSSLAREQGDRAIGVVMSGMGSDGTLGLQAIKSQGGLAVAQDPHSAQFASMPESAIASGAVDIIGSAADLPRRILLVAANPRTTRGRDGDGPPVALREDDGDTHLEAILALLHAGSRHDLSLYKPSTLRRRIERRMAVHGIDRMAQYSAYLAANPVEVDLLFKEILIGVTSFFRDPAVWDELGNSVLPELIGSAARGQGFRAWVAGCSTGEEAYSLAMVFCEALDAFSASAPHALQIFATDLNGDAIAYARRAHYPAAIAAGIGARRLARFFLADGDGYRVQPHIREMVLFAQHDLNMDPPFTRLDVLCCRNLLIYFSASLQKRLMPLFHYSLRPGGILVLGESETIGNAHGLFRPLATPSRLFRRTIQESAYGAVHFPVNRRFPSQSRVPELPMSREVPVVANIQALADQLLLQRFCPAAVLVNEQGDILYVSGRTGAYLEPAAGKANWNIHVMARPEIRTPLAIALRQVIKERKATELHGLRIEASPARLLDITVEAIDAPAALERMVMIVFRAGAAVASGRPRQRPKRDAQDANIGAELLQAQQEILALRETIRASEEERQAAIEELQSANEELQSANEELTTSKEEAQSMNEELQTINAELQSKLDDLALAQSDMQNLLNSTDIATLFLDPDLNVRRFTEQVKRIIRLRDGDVGRPLSDLASTLDYPELCADAMETLRTLAFREKEVATSDGQWFKVRIMPYRTVANVIQGAVITFVDITAAKQLESRLRNA